MKASTTSAVDKRFVQYMPTDRPLALDSKALGQLFEIRESSPEPFEKCGPAAVVDICGPLCQKPNPSWLDYQSIIARVKAAAESDAQAVVLRVDSPGGDALGMIECSRAMKAACDAARKPLLAFVDGKACSAAYSLITAANVIVTPPAALVGSIGVFQPMVDQTVADRAMGLTYRMVASGEHKLDGNPHVPITDSAEAETKRHVDGLASLFFALVAEMRPRANVKSIRDLEGRVFLGQDAIEVGLADSLGTFDDVLAMVANTDTRAAASAKATENTMADEKQDKKAAARKAIMGAVEAMQKALDAAFGDEEKEEDKDEPEKEEGKAKASDGEEMKKDEEKAKASDEKDDEKAKALFSLAAQVQSLKAEREAEKYAAALKDLLDTRPDFDAKIRATLTGLSITKVREAVETWPKTAYNPALAASVTGTPGKSAGNPEVPAPRAEVITHIEEKMGLATQFSGEAMVTESGGFARVFQPITQDQAKARLAALDKKGV